MGCGSSSPSSDPSQVGVPVSSSNAVKYAVNDTQQLKPTQQSNATSKQSNTPQVVPLHPSTARSHHGQPTTSRHGHNSSGSGDLTPRESWNHTTRIVKNEITGEAEYCTYTGVAVNWGFISCAIPVDSDHPVIEIIVVSVSVSDGFLFGLSPRDSPLSSVPGMIPNSIAWNPSKGHIVVGKKIKAHPISIVPQVGDRIAILRNESTKELIFELNDGVVGRIPLTPELMSIQLTPNLALIGGGTVLSTSPMTFNERFTERTKLVKASESFLSHLVSHQQQIEATKKFMRRLQRDTRKKIDVATNELIEAATRDPNLDRTKLEVGLATREQVKLISKEEMERTMIRQVKLKLRALRAMWCPARKATTMWRKCLARAQERKKKGLQRQESTIKRTPSTVTKPPPQPMPATPVSNVMSTFRTVPKTKVLSENIFLDQYQGKVEGGLTQYEWIIRNEQVDQLIIEMNFSKCRGLDLHGEVIQKSHVKAYEHKLIAMCTQIQAKAGFGMSYGIQCTTLPPDECDMKAAAEVDSKEIKEADEKMKQSSLQIPSWNVPSSAHSNSHNDPSHELTSLLTQLRSNDLHFLDRSFPPNESSIYSIATSNGKKNTLQHLPIAWRRLHTFLGPQNMALHPPSFFKPQIDPNDIFQGRLGNCFQCSAFSAVAETPELIIKLFGNEQQVNEVGLYVIRLCISGEWRNIYVDDYFPCYPGAGPIFTRNHGSQLWVLFLEKAFAKVYGSYSSLISGQAHHALADLTGYPVKNWNLDHTECEPLLANNAELLWRELLDGAEQDLSMCAGTIGKENVNDSTHDQLKSVGLVAGHAYTLLNVFEVPKSAKSSAGTRLLELRNPWGNGEWTGEWSDASPLWTPELKELIKPKISAAVEDGLFYMSLKDFLKYFCSVSACYIRSPKSRPWKEARFKQHWNMTPINSEDEHLSAALADHQYEFEVKRETDLWSVIYQTDSRLPNTSPMVDQGIMIIRRPSSNMSSTAECQLSDDPIVILADSKLTVSRQTNITARLTAGKYIALPYTAGRRIREQNQPQRPFNVAFFADEGSVITSIRQVTVDRTLYKRVFATLILKALPSPHLSKFGKDHQLWMYQLRHGSSHLYGCTINPSSRRPYEVTLNCSTSLNGWSHRRGNASTRLVKPGEFLIFHHMTPIEETQPTSYNVDINFKTIKEGK